MRSFRAASAAAVLAVSVLLAGSTALPSYADPQQRDPERPDLPAQASDRAEEALQLAQDVLAGVDSSVEPTIALRDLFLLRDELTGEDREQADQILARPDGQSPGSDFDHLWQPGAEARPVCNARICVHYVTSGAHAATYREARATLANVTRSWKVEIGGLGYRAPRRDGPRGDRKWADSKGRLDVYLAELGSSGIFGYVAPEDEPAATDDGRWWTTTGYMVLDQDYAEFGCPSTADCRRVTAAHELFHLIQYAYHANQHRWFMESTATWMEERVFDGVNDNRNYLQYGQLKNPGDPLTQESGNAPYGNWLVHEFYTQRKGNVVVKRAWYYASRGNDWRRAISASLNRSGWSWPAMYTAYAGNNNFPAHTYSEGRAYRSATASPRDGRVGSGSASLAPHSSVSVQFPPRDGSLLTSATGPELTLAVDLEPGTNHRAYVVVQTAGDGIRRYLIRLNANGDGARTFPFRSEDVRHVTLTLVNASTGSASARYTASA